ncbi:GNAT family N-acetyltransferase [Brevibacillus migulae]|uniref:GNAT family N-acetyltransferase n=1 Tax=Brevibacillus migulae TaxID=1644114 RepID=UPI00106E5E20|nr:GNAT family N-acetyltransferase [Brevibacillus migulae]
MVIELQRLTSGSRQLFSNLFELYTYDFSVYMNVELDDHGRFVEGYINRYIQNGDYHPYVVRYFGKIAGFAIVKVEGVNRYSMDQFFILKQYRRTGLGKRVAFQLFTTHPGEWRVAQLASNIPAQAFWRHVIREYTGCEYQEVNQKDTKWSGSVQTFQNR